jgi:hypothetical protein
MLALAVRCALCESSVVRQVAWPLNLTLPAATNCARLLLKERETARWESGIILLR